MNTTAPVNRVDNGGIALEPTSGVDQPNREESGRLLQAHQPSESAPSRDPETAVAKLEARFRRTARTNIATPEVPPSFREEQGPISGVGTIASVIVGDSVLADSVLAGALATIRASECDLHVAEIGADATTCRIERLHR